MKKVKCLMIVLFVIFVFVAFVGCDRGGNEQDFDLPYISQEELRNLTSSIIGEGYGAMRTSPPGNMLPGMIDFTQIDVDSVRTNADNFPPAEYQIRITEEMLRSTIARDNSTRMLLQFGPLFDRLRFDDDVRFYDEFYSYFPEEEQHHFTYVEAIEFDQRLSYISSFGSHNLRVIRGAPDFFMRNFIFFNPLNPNVDINVRPAHTWVIEAIQQTNQLIEIPDMPGYYVIYNDVFDIATGFIFMDGENYFYVGIGHSHVGLGDFPAGFSQIMISTTLIDRSITEMIELIRGLRFCEFVEGWGRYVA